MRRSSDTSKGKEQVESNDEYAFSENEKKDKVILILSWVDPKTASEMKDVYFGIE